MLNKVYNRAIEIATLKSDNVKEDVSYVQLLPPEETWVWFSYFNFGNIEEDYVIINLDELTEDFKTIEIKQKKFIID